MPKPTATAEVSCAVDPTERSPSVTTVVAEAPEVISADVVEIWSAVIQRVRKERPLVASNVEATMLLEINADAALVGIDSRDTLSVDLLDSPNNRKFLERLLAEATGRPLTIKFAKREGLIAAPPPREPEPQPAAPKDPLQEFKNDPLIRKALELFKAEIQPA